MRNKQKFNTTINDRNTIVFMKQSISAFLNEDIQNIVSKTVFPLNALCKRTVGF